MEVDKNNFEEYLPRISESIAKAEFIGKKYRYRINPLIYNFVKHLLR